MYPASSAGTAAALPFWLRRQSGTRRPIWRKHRFAPGRSFSSHCKKKAMIQKDHGLWVVEVNGLEPLTLCL